MKSTTLPEYLSFYKDNNYDEKIRVSFVYNFIKNMIYLLIPIILYTFWIHWTNNSYRSAVLPISLEVAIIFTYILLLKQIRNGYYVIVAHVALIMAFVINWAIMFTSTNDIIMRLSSVSYTLALLTITPIFVEKRTHIIIYSILNILMVIIFGLFAYLFYDISKLYFYDFISDNVLSIVLLTFALISTKKIYEILMYKSSEEIKKRQEAENELRIVNFELEQTVQERTKELKETLEKLEISNLELNDLNNNLVSESQKLIELNDKLAQKEMELSRSNITKEKILQIISHEIRTPLQAFLMNSEILKIHSPKMSPDEAKLVNDNMIRSVKELYHLFEDLMSFSNIKLGNIKPEPSKFNLYDFINTSVQVFKPSIDNNKIDVKNNIPQDVEITTDQSILNSIFASILSNSLKYSKNNGTIQIAYLDNINNHQIIIEDDGIGISSDSLEQILIRYRESINSEEVVWDGNLSGLSLSLNLIDQIDGIIDIHSEIDKGTSVIIKLPKK